MRLLLTKILNSTKDLSNENNLNNLYIMYLYIIMVKLTIYHLIDFIILNDHGYLRTTSSLLNNH